MKIHWLPFTLRAPRLVEHISCLALPHGATFALLRDISKGYPKKMCGADPDLSEVKVVKTRVKRIWVYLSPFVRYGAMAVVAVYFAGGLVFADEEFALSENLLETVKNDFGRSAKRRLEEWRDFINKTKHKTDLSNRDKLELVNDFFNENIEFLDDIDHWGKEDYWATPVETLVTEGGDCEDFSIAKYFTLKEIGVPIRKMLLTYVKALELDQAHMVLTYYEKPSSEPLVLDNLIDEIEPASERDDLAPVYSFNGRGLWLAKQRGLGKRVGGSGRISLWKDLGVRMKKEGFKK